MEVIRTRNNNIDTGEVGDAPSGVPSRINEIYPSVVNNIVVFNKLPNKNFNISLLLYNNDKSLISNQKKKDK